MEKKQNNLDSFFKENLSDFELSEKKANWELLNHLLNEQERKKKRRFWIFFILLFSIGSLSGLFFLMPGKKPAPVVEVKITPNAVSGDVQPVHRKKPGPPVAEITSVNKEIVRTSSIQIPLQIHSTTTPLSHKKNKTEKPVFAGFKETTIVNAVTPVKEVAGSDETQTRTSISDTLKASAGEIIKTGDAKPGNSDVPSPLVRNKVIADSVPSIPIAAGPDAINPAIEIPSALDSIDTTIKSAPGSDSTVVPVPGISKFIVLNFLAGINIYNSGSSTGLAPLAGFGLLHSFGSRFSIDLSILYSLQGGFNLCDTLTSVQETYFLDKTATISTQAVQVRQLHKLYLPLSLYFSLSRRHAVLVAIQPSYVLNTNGTFTQKTSSSGSIVQSENRNAKGYMDGIKSTNISISLGYKYYISKRFDVDVRFTQELMDRYEKKYFTGVRSSPSLSVQTFLILKF